MILRYYQENGIIDCAKEFQKGLNSIVYQLATGGGKTVIFTEITKRFIDKNESSVVIVVHRTELLKQTRKNLYKEYNIVACLIEAGMKHVPEARVYICMVESLNRRLEKLKNVGLLILDECHIAVHNKIIDKLKPPYIIGFSATPISSNKKEPLNKRYQSIILGPQIKELIDGGNLCQNLTYAPKMSVDRNNLKIRGDDFDEVIMGKEFSKAKFVINTVDAYRKWCFGKKTVIFNVNIDHSRLVCEEFVSQGFNARFLDSKCKEEDRDEILAWLKTTDDAILCNVGILTTGFDEPSIESIIVNKATNSVALWLQMTGRGSRPAPNKSMFTIIDMGGNAVTHGDWCDHRDWKDVFENPVKKSKNSVAPCKNCPECEAILHASALECKYCNFIFPPKKVEVEELLNDYVILTKNIDIPKLIEENDKKKQYYTFFKIIREHVYHFKKSKRQVTDEIFEFISENVQSDCKKWCHLNNKKFNAFNRNLCLTELQKELKYEYRLLQSDNKS